MLPHTIHTFVPDIQLVCKNTDAPSSHNV